ncbi:hypothetical protein OXX80_008676 [Metschnikowia pulcherrima]
MHKLTDNSVNDSGGEMEGEMEEKDELADPVYGVVSNTEVTVVGTRTSPVTVKVVALVTVIILGAHLRLHRVTVTTVEAGQ